MDLGGMQSYVLIAWPLPETMQSTAPVDVVVKSGWVPVVSAGAAVVVTSTYWQPAVHASSYGTEKKLLHVSKQSACGRREHPPPQASRLP